MSGVDVDRLLEGAPVHDRADLLARLCDDEGIAAEVMSVFFSDLPQQLALLDGGFDAADPESVRRQSHTIKGACGNVGAAAMRLVAYEIEKAAGRGDLIEARRYFDRLRAEFGRLKTSCGV